MFRMLGKKVELYRYKIVYADEEEFCISEEHKNEIEQMLTTKGVTFTTTPVDQTANEWLNGLEFDSYDKALELFNKGEVVYEENIALKNSISGLLLRTAVRKLLKEATMTDEDLIEMIDIFPSWDSLIGRLIQIGTKFKYDGNLYRVEQENTFQTDWLPNELPALYTKIVPDNVIPIWVQPIGSTDAYSFGDKVTYNGEVWESIWEGENVNTAVPDGDIPYNRYWVPVV